MEPSMPAWTAASLFDVWFRPLYPEDLRDDLAALAAARATDANPGENPRFRRELEETADVFVRLAPAALGRPELQVGIDDASVHHVSAAFDRTTRDALLAASRPGDPSSPFVNVVIHGALWLARCVVDVHGGVWGVRRPLWESVVRLQSRAGEATLAPFHWWLKALSDDEVDKGGLASRYRHYVERAMARPEELPKIVKEREDRTLPTLKIVRYDLLHKHLRAHLPELRDVGRDFPTPEEFAELGFLELHFLLLGGGRMLLLHGRGKRGLHLLWLDHQGFSHAAFFPASSGDPHSVTVEGDRLVVRFRAEGRDLVHEMLWWG
jgi:hypothetical protein